MLRGLNRIFDPLLDNLFGGDVVVRILRGLSRTFDPLLDNLFGSLGLVNTIVFGNGSGRACLAGFGLSFNGFLNDPFLDVRLGLWLAIVGG